MFTQPSINFATIIPKFDAILKRGLCSGVGRRDGQMCIEAAICAAMDLPHGDDPQCVSAAVRFFKIRLNDAAWSSPAARASGLRDLGIAQIGSKGVVDNQAFTKRLTELTIRQLIPTLFREVFTKDTPQHVECRQTADVCERDGTTKAARGAATAAYAAYAAAYAPTAYAAAYAAAYTPTSYAAASAYVSYAFSASGDKYLLLSASLALQVLRELGSPGVAWL